MAPRSEARHSGPRTGGLARTPRTRRPRLALPGGAPPPPGMEAVPVSATGALPPPAAATLRARKEAVGGASDPIRPRGSRLVEIGEAASTGMVPLFGVRRGAPPSSPSFLAPL